MSRELWVVEKTYCDEVIGAYRYKIEPQEITKYPDNIRVTRYVPADTLQPEWWCEQVHPLSWIFYVKIGDVIASKKCSGLVEPHIREILVELAQSMAFKLWCEVPR